MAALYPVRVNFQQGTIASAMASSATAISFGAVPAFPTLTADQYIAIQLINTNAVSDSEVIYMTGYTSGNSTGAVLRAQEGASAVSWAGGATWDHAPTVNDFINLTAAVISGNTAGATANISSGTMTIAGGNNVTISQNGNAITISGPTTAAQTVQTQNMVSVQGSTGDISFGNANGITFGGNNSTLTASHNALTSQSNQALSGSNGSFTFQTATFGNLNGMSFYTSNGSMVGSYTVPSVPAQTNQTVGLYAAGNTSGTSSGTLDARSFTVSVAGSITADITNGRLNLSVPNAITTAMASNRGSDFVAATAAFAGTNANGTIASNGVSVSVPAQTNQSVGLYVSGQTSGTSTGTADARSLSFNVVGGSLTLDATNGKVNISAPNAITTAMASNRGSDFVQANAAFAGTNANGTIASSGISVSVPAQTNQSVGLYGLGNTSGTSTATVDARSLSVSAAGSITADMSGGTIRLSVPNAITTAMASNRGSDFVQATAAFAGTNASGTIASNGLSVSVSNQSNQSVGLYASGNTSGTSTATADARSLTFNAQGSITVDVTNGKVNLSVPNALTTAMASNRGSDFVQATAAFAGTNAAGTIASNGISVSAAAQTNQSLGLYVSGQTSGTSTGTADARSLSFNIVGGSLTLDATNGKVNISAPNALTTAMASNRGTDFVQANANFNGTNASGTIASNNISVSVAAQSAQTVGLYGAGNTAGTSSGTADARSLSFDVAGSLTVNMSNDGKIHLSAPNAITTAMASNRGTDFVQATAAFAGTNANGTIASNGISVSVAAQSVQTQGLVPSAGVSTGGNTSGNTGTTSGVPIVFQGGNGVRLSQATATDGATVVVSMLSQAYGVSSGGNTLGDTGVVQSRLVLAGGNNITLSQSTAAGQLATVTISGPNTVAQTNQTIGIYGSSQTTGQSSSSTYDARSLTLRGAGVISIGNSGGEIIISGSLPPGSGDGYNILAAGTQTAGASTSVKFADSNGVTFGMSNSSQITASVNTSYLGTDQASKYVQSWELEGNNTSGTTGSLQGSALYLSGGNNITLSGNSNTIVLSGVSFANGNNITFGLNAGTLTASFNPINVGVSTGGNTAGTTGTLDGAGAQYVFVGGSNVTLSQSINGSNGTLSIHAGPDFDFFEPIPPLQSGSTTFAMGVSSWYFQPMQVPAYVGPGRLNVLHTMGGTSQTVLQGSTGTVYASNTTGGASQSFIMSRIIALYSRGTGTNNTRLESMWAATFPISVSHSVGISLSNATQVTASRQVDLRYPSQVDISGNSTIATIQGTHATSSAGSSVGTSFFTSALASIYNILSGAVMMPIPITAQITPGNYWLAHAWVTAHTAAGSTLNPVLPALTAYGIYNSSSYNHRPFGVTAASSGSQYNPGHGVFSVQSAAPPNNVDFRDIRSYASNAIPYYNIMASSIS